MSNLGLLNTAVIIRGEQKEERRKKKEDKIEHFLGLTGFTRQIILVVIGIIALCLSVQNLFLDKFCIMGKCIHGPYKTSIINFLSFLIVILMFLIFNNIIII